MSADVWLRAFDTTSGQVVVIVVGDPYLDAGTQKHRNLRVEVRVSDLESLDRLTFSGPEALSFAEALRFAAAYVEASQ